MPASKKNYQVKSNEFVFTISSDDIARADLIKINPAICNLISGHRSVNVKFVGADINKKKVTVEIDGELFEVLIKDELDQMLDQMGFSASASKQIKEIKAPMPGLVLEIAVVDGQEMNEGDKVLILGAMKMENSILIHANSTIKKVLVSAGQAVEKGQVLIELE
jgi:acetyl/propionyl-CoA carboxylase alpha subunit